VHNERVEIEQRLDVSTNRGSTPAEDLTQRERQAAGEMLYAGPDLVEVAGSDRFAGAGKQLEVRRVVRIG
jgi:hypothetical protein